MKRRAKVTLVDLAAQAGYKLNLTTPIMGFSVDSRTIKPGEVFIALPGNKVDGHAYLGEVAAKGAIAAIVAPGYQQANLPLLLIPVSNGIRFLQDLAKWWLAELNPRIIGVTGSIGKTTAKEFIKVLLQGKYRLAATPGNHNSQIGLPLAILNQLDPTIELFVAEMGMTAPEEIAKLTTIAPPDVAVITSVALVHATRFEEGDEWQTLLNIARAKGEILTHPKTKQAFICRDILHFDALMQQGFCKKSSFSISSPFVDFFLRPKNEGIHVAAPQGHFLLPKLSVEGFHNHQNFLAALAVALHFGLEAEEIAMAMSKLALPERRLERCEKKGVLFINDSYNASVPSFKAALESLPAPTGKGRKIAVIGEMRETTGVLLLGKFSEKGHRQVGEYALECVDQLFCLGKECQPIEQLWREKNRPVTLTLTRQELVAALRQELCPGDVVLLKGSQINGLWHILQEI